VVITVSRQAECGGDEIVDLVAQRAGLRVADRAILERMAQQGGLPVAHVARFDEVALGPLEALIAEWQTSISHEHYVRRLATVLLALEREGNVVILGRGAAFLLTDPGTFHIRIIAPMPCRIARLCPRHGIPSIAAERMLRKSDEQRRRFIRHAFDSDIDSPLHYDLAINTAELPLPAAADMIIVGAQRKFLERAAEETGEDLTARLLRFRHHPRLPRVSAVVWEQSRRVTGLSDR
jgi:cytidylate kinase